MIQKDEMVVCVCNEKRTKWSYMKIGSLTIGGHYQVRDTSMYNGDTYYLVDTDDGSSGSYCSDLFICLSEYRFGIIDNILT